METCLTSCAQNDPHQHAYMNQSAVAFNPGRADYVSLENVVMSRSRPKYYRLEDSLHEAPGFHTEVLLNYRTNKSLVGFRSGEHRGQGIGPSQPICHGTFFHPLYERVLTYFSVKFCIQGNSEIKLKKKTVDRGNYCKPFISEQCVFCIVPIWHQICFNATQAIIHTSTSDNVQQCALQSRKGDF